MQVLASVRISIYIVTRQLTRPFALVTRSLLALVTRSLLALVTRSLLALVTRSLLALNSLDCEWNARRADAALLPTNVPACSAPSKVVSESSITCTSQGSAQGQGWDQG